MSQPKVCESSTDEFVDLNTIGKCAIEKFKKSEKKEFVKISTRNRFVRKRNKYLTTLKTNLNSVSNESAVVVKEVAVKEDVVKVVKSVMINKEERSLMRFDEVADIPVFINCTGLSLEEKKGCVKEVFVNNILDNFTYPFDAASEGIEGRVWVRFIIDTDGYVKNVTTAGPSNGVLLEKEAKRLVGLLPKFVPGKHNNEYVDVEYFMPIDFQLDE